MNIKNKLNKIEKTMEIKGKKTKRRVCELSDQELDMAIEAYENDTQDRPEIQ